MVQISARLISLGLMSAGSLLPWSCSGDLNRMCTVGMGIDWYAGMLRLEDHGGGPILCLSLLLAIIVVWNPAAIRTLPLIRWCLISLALLIGLQTSMLIVTSILEYGSSAQTLPDIGLPVMWLGVAIAVWSDRHDRPPRHVAVAQPVARGKPRPPGG